MDGWMGGGVNPHLYLATMCQVLDISTTQRSIICHISLMTKLTLKWLSSLPKVTISVMALGFELRLSVSKDHA